MNMLLKKKVVKLYNSNTEVIIEPFWLEAYFYRLSRSNKNDINHNVVDLLTHKNDMQRNHFLKLYFHNSYRKYNGCRSGVDLVLSNDEDTYFSILFKGVVFLF